jgi:hypothetical protein
MEASSDIRTISSEDIITTETTGIIVVIVGSERKKLERRLRTRSASASSLKNNDELNTPRGDDKGPKSRASMQNKRQCIARSEDESKTIPGDPSGRKKFRTDSATPTLTLPEKGLEESLKESLFRMDEREATRLQLKLLEQHKTREEKKADRLEALVWDLVNTVHSLPEPCLPECKDRNQEQKIEMKMKACQEAITKEDISDLLVNATRFAKLYQYFSESGIQNGGVDIGFQYYLHDKISGINEPVIPACSYSGSGSYTGDDPFAFYPYHEAVKHQTHSSGNMKEIVGVVVARLKGSVRDGDQCSATSEGDKGERRMYTSVRTRLLQNNRPDVLVLSKPDQCLALLRFTPANDVIDLLDNDAPGNQILFEYHCELQHILDEVFNNGRPTAVVRARASDHPAFQPYAPRNRWTPVTLH